ncbi:MAG TPA: hydrogenase maturation protein [Steroidobacteraceae bacterium]|nr:hydrogenase maturation protein [Steroidobacteraceae bacterium]
MRILLLTQAFNSLSQRLYVELTRDGHELSVELDIHDRVTLETIELFRPEVVLAPFLKRAIPESLWRRLPCLIVHPGPQGDRGPAALDWAILRGVPDWGVTVLEAAADWDTGPVWASVPFPMRLATKSSLYRNEVTECAVVAVRAALERLTSGAGPVALENRSGAHGWQPPVPAAQRSIDWARDSTAAVLRKIRSADGAPGVEDLLLERRFRLFDAHPERRLAGRPGTLIARHHEAVCVATRDGAVWIGQLKALEGPQQGLKRPAALALGTAALTLPEGMPCTEDGGRTGDLEIRYEERGAVGYLHFAFYNGALSSAQCERLRAAYAEARARSTRVIVLMGGPDFWCNGMHLHCIEAAASAADESWANINAIDDLTRDILTTGTHLTVAAMQGNAAAGGVFLALAADRVLARSGIVLNPHYRNMGNLYGSEYWTYLLPRRVGAGEASALMARRLPLGVHEAQELGLIDEHAGPDGGEFRALVEARAAELAEPARFALLLEEKRARRARDERQRALAAYRAEELEHMHLNFYGFDPSYHIARHRFVYRTPHAWTPLHLAAHRRIGFAARQGPASA